MPNTTCTFGNLFTYQYIDADASSSHEFTYYVNVKILIDIDKYEKNTELDYVCVNILEGKIVIEDVNKYSLSI